MKIIAKLWTKPIDDYDHPSSCNGYYITLDEEQVKEALINFAKENFSDLEERYIRDLEFEIF